MQNLIKQYTPKLEQDLIALYTGNESAKKWFSESIKEILESTTLTPYSKCDAIAEVFGSIDSKLEYLKEQQNLLSSLKKQLELAKSFAKEEVSKSLSSYGLTKLEGMKVSSISVVKEDTKQVPKLVVHNKDELLKLGYFSVILDEKAVEEALLSADKRPEVEEYADIKIEVQSKPASIRINKRKASIQNDSQIAA